MMILVVVLTTPAHAGTQLETSTPIPEVGNPTAALNQLPLILPLATPMDNSPDRFWLTGLHGDSTLSKMCLTKSKCLRADTETGEL